MERTWEIYEIAMARAGVPAERIVAESSVIEGIATATQTHDFLLEKVLDRPERIRAGIRAALIASLLHGARNGMTSNQLRGEFYAAVGEVFWDDSSIRELGPTYGYVKPSLSDE